MKTLRDFALTQYWPPRNEKALQLYSVPTPNGMKVSIMLEEIGLPYDLHKVSFAKADQLRADFLEISPNNKIPALIDPHGPNGGAVSLFESGAILLYLAEKSGQLLPSAQKWDITQWLMFQMGGLGPMFGQLGFFYKNAGAEVKDPLPRERYRQESRRLLGVLDRALEGRDWIAGDYSIADIAIGPWLRSLIYHTEAGDLVGWATLNNLPAYLERFLARPAVIRAYSAG